MTRVIVELVTLDHHVAELWAHQTSKHTILLLFHISILHVLLRRGDKQFGLVCPESSEPTASQHLPHLLE